jgi:ABC-type Mn2+/Zn2+ transport system permease subunit
MTKKVKMNKKVSFLIYGIIYCILAIVIFLILKAKLKIYNVKEDFAIMIIGSLLIAFAITYWIKTKMVFNPR